MRACYPDRDGYAEREGVKTFYEVFGEGDTTLLMLPAWSIVHSRIWKMQVPYLARHYRVLTFDGRGNGRSDRPVIFWTKDSPRPNTSRASFTSSSACEVWPASFAAKISVFGNRPYFCSCASA